MKFKFVDVKSLKDKKTDKLFDKQPRTLIPVFTKNKISHFASQLDKDLKGFISHALEANNFTKNKRIRVLTPQGQIPQFVFMAKIDDDKKPLDWEKKHFEYLGSDLFDMMNDQANDGATFVLDEILVSTKISSEKAVALIAYGMLLKSYTFEKYHTENEDTNKHTPLKKVTFLCQNADKVEKKFDQLEKIAQGIFLTRDLVTEPPNVLYPETFAHQCKDLEKLGIKVRVLDKKELQKQGMGSLLGVAQGSEKDPYVVVMEYNHSDDKGKDKDKEKEKDKEKNKKSSSDGPLVLVGKGVTFDSGGISLKPGAGMWDMKWDMGGAAVVTGTMKAIAGQKLSAHVVGIIGLVENMPSSKAQRPSDIVTSMSGKTIEVLNTDAEGRLVLVDLFAYVQKYYKPKAMIDLATLTGAVLIALGNEYAGFFTSNAELAQHFKEVSKITGEKIWHLPMDPEFTKDLKSEIADIKNIAGESRMAGSSVAACFLEYFVDKKLPWIHFDIAGTTWSGKPKPSAPKGATGFGVKLLVEFIDHCWPKFKGNAS